MLTTFRIALVTVAWVGAFVMFRRAWRAFRRRRTDRLLDVQLFRFRIEIRPERAVVIPFTTHKDVA
jgi:hypothetical protein